MYMCTAKAVVAEVVVSSRILAVHAWAVLKCGWAGGPRASSGGRVADPFSLSAGGQNCTTEPVDPSATYVSLTDDDLGSPPPGRLQVDGGCSRAESRCG